MSRSKVNELFVQGRWDASLVESALSSTKYQGRTRDWIDYLDICQSIRGISVPDWKLLADHYIISAERSPELLFKLTNLIIAPGVLQNATQKDLLSCHTKILQLPRARFSNGLSESLFSGFLGKCVAHYPHLLVEKSLLKTPTIFFSRQPEVHRIQATKLLSLTTSFSNLVSEMLKSSITGHIEQTTARLAVVGNSPTLLAQNKGAEIDEADIVIRFNRVSQKKETQCHTGSRTDLWVMSPSTNTRLCPSDAKGVVLTGLQSLQRPSFFWRGLPDLNLPLSQLPATIWYELVSRFHAPPSAGTLMLASLHALPLDLDIRCYGFTTSDKDITHTANHYADNTPRSTRHNWQAETKWLNESIN